MVARTLRRLTRETKKTAAGNITYDIGQNYDAVGNITTKLDHKNNTSQSFTFNAADQITNSGFSYDDNGNLLTEVGGAYQYDTQDRLTQATKSGVTCGYAYDGDNNRIRKTEGGSTTEYIVDRMGGLAQVVAEVNPDNTITAFYVRGDDLISQWRKTNGSESVSYYGYDGHGSTAILTDSGGTATDRWCYDAWGNIVERDGTTTNVYRYTGQQQDGTGLYYLRARYYDPAMGRFGQRDPAEGREQEPTSLHKYVYCVNNPVNASDPSGRMGVVGVVVVVIAVLLVLWLVVGGIRALIDYNRAMGMLSESKEAGSDQVIRVKTACKTEFWPQAWLNSATAPVEVEGNDGLCGDRWWSQNQMDNIRAALGRPEHGEPGELTVMVIPRKYGNTGLDAVVQQGVIYRP